MPLFTAQAALRDFLKTPVILNAVLSGVDQQRAQTATDGADGWSVLEVVCHLNDYEQIFLDRAKQIINEDRPDFPPYSQNELAAANRYSEQALTEVLASYYSRRRSFIDFLHGLPDEQWARSGVHASYGEMTLVELVVKTTLHDVNHIEQIVKALGTSPQLSAL